MDMKQRKTPDIGLSELRVWLSKAMPHIPWAELEWSSFENAMESLHKLDPCNRIIAAPPASMSERTVWCAERMPVRASIWNAKPSAKLMKILTDRMFEEDSIYRYTSALVSDITSVGPDSLYFVVANFKNPYDRTPHVGDEIRDWYNDSTGALSILTGSWVSKDKRFEDTQLVSIAGLQLSSYKPRRH